MKHKYLRKTPHGFVSCKRAWNRLRYQHVLWSDTLPDGVWEAVAEKLSRRVFLEQWRNTPFLAGRYV